MNNEKKESKYMKSHYKPGWLSMMDLHLNNTRGRMKEMVEVSEAYDEILTKPEMTLVTSFTEKVEKLCAKFIKDVYELNPDWELILNPEREWWLKKKGYSTE